MWTQGLLAITLMTHTPASPREAREPQTPRSFGSVAVDTVFAVRTGQRLLVDNFAGDVHALSGNPQLLAASLDNAGPAGGGKFVEECLPFFHRRQRHQGQQRVV